MIADIIFHAGTKDKNDIYSLSDGAADWQLIKFFTTEITPDSKEKCKENWEKLEKEMKQSMVGICRTNEVIPKDEKQFESFLMKELKKLQLTNQISSKIMNLQSDHKIETKLDWKLIGSVLMQKMGNSDAQTDDDFNLLLAAPNFGVMKMIFNLMDDKAVKTLKRIFLLEKLNTNIKFHLPADVMRSVLQPDPNWPDNSRPVIPKDGTSLIADARDLFHKHILVKDKVAPKIMIRLLSTHKLKEINENFTEKKYNQRVYDGEAQPNDPKIAQQSNLETNESEIVEKKGEDDQWKTPQKKQKIHGEFIQQNSLDKVDEYISQKKSPGEVKPFGLTNFKLNQGWASKINPTYFETVIIHIHGGGFVCLSSSAHQHYLINWTKHHNVPIFSIDYRLAPEAKTPELFNDCINGYLWI